MFSWIGPAPSIGPSFTSICRGKPAATQAATNARPPSDSVGSVTAIGPPARRVAPGGPRQSSIRWNAGSTSA